MKKTLSLIVITIMIISCQQKAEKRISILDRIVNIEDSIYYKIDSLPMLCDELNMKKQWIDIDDCKLYCEVEGEGIPLVLINGGPGGTHHCFHPWFKKAEKFCKVIYYDQRGCGQSDFEKGDGYTFRQAIDDLDKLRQKLDINKWIVCGYSYGGALAQYYTSVYSENVLGMVLIGSATLLQDDEIYGSREQTYISKEEKAKINEIYKLYRSKKINLLQLLYNKELNGDWKRQSFYKPTPDEVIRGALYEWVNDDNFNRIMGESYRRYDFKGVFDKCPIPTLVCEGKYDLTWAEKKAGILKNNHPNAQFKTFEMAGHTIFSEETELFFSTLKKFVKNLKDPQAEQLRTWQTDVKRILDPQEKLFFNEAKFFKMIEQQGIDKAAKHYHKVKGDELPFSEQGLNSYGYTYMRKKDFAMAIEVFKLNVDAFPDSWNVYDSLGEAYMKSGNKKLAIKCYKKSVEMNPDNENGKKMLAKLKEGS